MDWKKGVAPRVACMVCHIEDLRVAEVLKSQHANYAGAVAISSELADLIMGGVALTHAEFVVGQDEARFGGLADWLRANEVDVFVVSGSRWMIPTDVLDAPTIGVLGAHPSRLPWGRGGSPMAWSIAQATPGHNCVFWMTNEMDGGAIAAQESIPISVTCPLRRVISRIADSNSRLVMKVLREIETSGQVPRSKIEDAGSHRRRLTRADNEIDWRDTARDIYDLVRLSGEPYDGAYTELVGSRLIVWKAFVAEGVTSAAPPGTVLGRFLSTHGLMCGLVVACGHGVLVVNDIGRPDMGPEVEMRLLGADLMEWDIVGRRLGCWESP